MKNAKSSLAAASSAASSYIRSVLRETSFSRQIFPSSLKVVPRTAHQLMRDALRIEKILNVPHILETVVNIELHTHSTGTSFILCPTCKTPVRFEGGGINLTRDQLPEAPASLVGHGITVQLCYCAEGHTSLFINGSNDITLNFTPTLNWMITLPEDFLEYERN
jgi:hypothetical protein